MLYPPSTGWPEKELSLQTDRPIYVVPLVPAGQKNNYHCRPTGRHTTLYPLNRDRPVRSKFMADRLASIICTHLVPAGQKKIIVQTTADICCTHLVLAGQKGNYHCRPDQHILIIVPFLNRPAVRSQKEEPVGHIYATHLVPAGRQNYHCRPVGVYVYPPSTGWEN